MYLVTFDLAGNPDGAPTTKSASVSAAAGTAAYTFDTTGHNKTSMGWMAESFTFAATGTTTILTFASTDNGTPYGAALDNVAVAAVPLPASLPMFGGALLGMAGLTLVARRRTGAKADCSALPA